MQLREYLKKNNITITDFAKKTEFTRPFLSLLIHGKRRISPRAAKILSSFTEGEVSVKEILSLNNEDLISEKRRKKSVAENTVK